MRPSSLLLLLLLPPPPPTTTTIKDKSDRSSSSSSSSEGNSLFWTIQTLDEYGTPKRIGGDEFYITYTGTFGSSFDRKKTQNNNQKLWSEEPDHPTATALVTDHGNGNYTLDFVQSPMPHHSSNHPWNHEEKQRQQSQSQMIDNDPSEGGGGGGGILNIHFVYTCGIGQMAPPTKDGWHHGGAIQISQQVNLSHSPPIRTFRRPSQHGAVDLSDYHHVLLVGDSVMQQFSGHGGVYFRQNVTTVRHSTALNTASVSGFVDAVWNAVNELIMTKISHNDNTLKLAIVIGSSTWDILGR